ncbi:MAG: hypothetical protein WB441_01065 [Nocardioidaceae bacterium]
MRRSATSSSLTAVQLILAAMLASTSMLAVAWIGGYNGVGVIPPLPQGLGLDLHETNGVPSEAVLVDGEPGLATVMAANAITGGINGTLSEQDASDNPNGILAGDGTSEFYGNRAFLSFWALTPSQHAAWVAVRVVPLVGGAIIWGTLLLVVRDIRRGHGFTTRTARRIAGIGLLLALGVPLVQVVRWMVARWLVESSTAATIADPVSASVPLWPIVVGLVLMVVALAWREAAGMRRDLQGLV